MSAIEEIEQEVQDCITNCKGAHDVCIYTLNHCLTVGGRHAAPQHVRLLLDCIEISQASIDFLLRGSGLHGAICAACAEVCEACARDCDQLVDGDAQMQACSRACWDAALSCRHMASEVAAGSV